LVEELKNVDNAETHLMEIVISDKGREISIDLRHVSHFQAYGNFLKVFVEGKSYLYRTTMSDMEAQLDSDYFLRVHRSYIVNNHYIKEIKYLTKNEYAFQMLDELIITSGRKFAERIKNHLSSRI